MPPLVLIDEHGNPLDWNTPTRQEPEVEIEPMEKIRLEAERQAAKQSNVNTTRRTSMIVTHDFTNAEIFDVSSVGNKIQIIFQSPASKSDEILIVTQEQVHKMLEAVSGQYQR